MSTDDAQFMLGLLNEPSWLRFIGDRGVRTIEDARNYILTGPIAMYDRLGYGFYIVESKADANQLGICGLAKRDFLDDPDIGFAFMPEHCGKGYGYEAAFAVLEYAKHEIGLQRVVATARPDNTISANLLEKLGLRYERMIRHPEGDRELKLFSIAINGHAA
jgi:RimJ/RimL family protein N-acetyltransferase